MSRVLDLPRFPLTEKYEAWGSSFETDRGFADQAFLYCEDCTHGMLENIIPDLYGSDYETRTHRSEGATQAVKHFSAFIKKHVDLRNISTMLDIGGNDASLLKQFNLKCMVSIDPNASEEVTAIKSCIENADLTPYKSDRKIIVCSHTIEHLVNPDVMLAKVSEVMGPEDILAIQFPSLELLVEDCRIDQIHHQHVHYFSERSITAFLARHGLAEVTASYDYSHWGALMVIARKGGGFISGSPIKREGLEDAIDNFRHQVSGVRLPYGCIGLGASLMLPVLLYWLPSIHRVQYIADDDPYKNGLRYVNFNKPIRNNYDLHGEDVVITAIGSNQAARKLTRKAIDAGARRVILPLNTL